MNGKMSKALMLAAVVAGLLVSTSFAGTLASAAVTPAITAPGGKVFIHTAVSNMTVSNEAVTVTLNITNPGTCVTGHLPPQAGALAFALKASETRFGELSLDIPASACSGTYTVSVLVKNSSGTVLASPSTKFTVTIPTP